MVHVPESAASDLALVIDLHGLASSPQSEDMLSGFSRLVTSAGVVVAQPSASGGIPAWDPSPRDEASVDDVGFVLAVIEDVSARASIDSGAVFVVGFSNGGGMAHRIACEAAETVAALGSVSGAYFVAEPCSPSIPVSVVAFHGTDDETVPYEGIGQILPPVEGWAARWAVNDGCGSMSPGSFAEDVDVASWQGCDAGTEVQLYTIVGGGHGWPGTSDRERSDDSTGTFDATAAMWDFFEAHRR